MNPVLRGLNEDQMNSLVDQMMVTLASGRAGERPQQPPVREAPKPLTNDDVKERFDPMSEKYDPVGAVRDIAAANFGGLITDIAQRANEGVFMNMRSVHPDFQDYEKEVRDLIQQSGNPNPTVAQISGAYYAAKGYRISQKEFSDRESARTRPPSAPKVEEGPKLEPLTDEEKHVARVTFPNSADPEKDYRTYLDKIESGDTTMKVPMNGGTKR